MVDVFYKVWFISLNMRKMYLLVLNSNNCYRHMIRNRDVQYRAHLNLELQLFCFLYFVWPSCCGMLLICTSYNLLSLESISCSWWAYIL